MAGRRRRYGARPGSGRGGPLPSWFRIVLVVALVGIGVGALRVFVLDAVDTDWSVAAPVWAAYVVGSLAAGALLAAVLHRFTKDFFRVYFFGGYLSLYLAWAAFAVPLTAMTGLQMAESVQCHRTDGVTVQATYSRTAYSGGRYNLDRTSWVGRYDAGGETYELVIREDADVLLRQAAAAVPADGAVTDPDVVRTYKVAWAGSSHPCARGTTSDFWRGFWIVVVGPWLGLGVILAGLAVRRRTRQTDESAPAPQSHPA